MAAIIILEDGRAFMGSNLGVTAMLSLMADQVSSNRPKLALWLADMSDRCAPFLDFDVRGLTSEDRAEFWAAAQRAFSALEAKHGPGFLEHENAYSANCLDKLLRMHRSIEAGQPPLILSDFDEPHPFDGQVIDLDFLWRLGDTQPAAPALGGSQPAAVAHGNRSVPKGRLSMQRLATGRLVGLLIAVVAIGLSVHSGCEALRMNAELHQWLAARPMETSIDLSQPGETTVPFHQTCSVSHGEGLYLKCDLGHRAQQNPQELLKGLSGKLIIRDSDGNQIKTLKLDNKTAQYWGDAIVLAGCAPFPKGKYVATIRVDYGAPPSPENDRSCTPHINCAAPKHCP